MKEDKKQRIYRTFMIIAMTIIITVVITTILLYNKIGDTKYIVVSGGEQLSSLNSKLELVKSLIDKLYLGKVDEDKLIQGAIKGYVEGLDDKYSEYYTAEEMEEVTEDNLGNFNGIGIYMIQDTENNQIVVLMPMEGSPAEKAGILPGDIITKINGEQYSGDQINEASNKMKGETDTEVEVEIIRDGKTLNFKIKTENVKINHIKTKVLDGTIGYIKMTTFDMGDTKEFEEKYNELKSKGIKSLIIDLRNNGGGIVDEALGIADDIIEKGKTTLITIDKDGKEEVKTSEKDPIINEKIVVLVNKNTASASEILVGILKDYNKATVVGTTTFGKGIIQDLMSLTDGSGIKLTTSEYLTPNRNKINEVGITPDIEIELPDDIENIYSIEEKQDNQLQKAIDILK